MMMFAPALILSQTLGGLFQHLLGWTTGSQDVKSGGEKNAAECFSELPASFDHNQSEVFKSIFDFLETNCVQGIVVKPQLWEHSAVALKMRNKGTQLIHTPNILVNLCIIQIF